MPSIEQQLFDNTWNGLVLKVDALLRENPGLDVNLKDTEGWYALHIASDCGHAELVKLLLAHPAINVNIQEKTESTPILFACQRSGGEAIQMLLNDPRVDISLADEAGHTHSGVRRSVDGLKWLSGSLQVEEILETSTKRANFLEESSRPFKPQKRKNTMM